MTRTCRATGEALLVPTRNRRSKVGRITGETGKSAEDERVAAGSGVARKRSNVRGAKGPCHLQCLQRKEGKDEMTKASNGLQDLRRRLYVKAKSETSWRCRSMDWPDYLRDQAVKYRQLAEQTDDPVIKVELLELASVCEEVASNIEDHLTGG